MESQGIPNSQKKFERKNKTGGFYTFSFQKCNYKATVIKSVILA